ncbi:MAG: hypothetical protein MPJ78_08970 [Hyphomicrobiaceae bacterium]|nr:hypothetical protein [Hyphomicrobiaceae bacterium]
MRSLATVVFAILFLAVAAPAHAYDARFSSPDRLLQWINDYRKNPQPYDVPAAVKAMHTLGLFKKQEDAGLLIGFIGGVLGSNQSKAEKLVARMFPMPAKEQGVIIRAIAYSGIPEWPRLMSKFEKRMPLRKPLINDYITGKEKTLDELRLDDGAFVIDALWGYYAATGYNAPVIRIITALPWANDVRGADRFSWSKLRAAFNSKEGKDAVRKITAGNMAKWTLTANAERDRGLLALYKMEVKYQPPEVAEPLKEVIEAAEAFQADRVQKQAQAAIDKIKAKHPGDAEWTRKTYAGSVAIATGCVVASATGLAGIGVPCVIGGALYSGAVKLWNTAR